MIPKLLSQTWKSRSLPKNAQHLLHGWKKHNPEFTYRLFDDAESRAVVADVVPQFIEAYDKLPFPVMRADIFRYAVIYRDGGIYADIDMECLKPLADLIESSSCLLSIEAHLTTTRARELNYPVPVQIANCIFAAPPQNPFFMAAIQQAFRLFLESETFDTNAIEDITGPKMLTRLLFNGEWDDIMLGNQIALIAPLNYPNVWPLNRNMFARHRTFGTWKIQGNGQSVKRRWIERNRLINPFPDELFFPSYELINRCTRLTQPSR